MPYRSIAYDHIKDAATHDVFRRANMYLADVYSMLGPRVREGSNAGGCNFSIALVLVSVIDGLAGAIYPTTAEVPKQKQRFCRLMRDKLPWGPHTSGWIDKGTAAKRIYVELHNPLTHELGRDSTEQSRPLGEYELVVNRWRTNRPGIIIINQLDALPSWDQSWPVLRWEPFGDGKRLTLSAAALYWAVKRMTMDLAVECR